MFLTWRSVSGHLIFLFLSHLTAEWKINKSKNFHWHFFFLFLFCQFCEFHVYVFFGHTSWEHLNEIYPLMLMIYECPLLFIISLLNFIRKEKCQKCKRKNSLAKREEKSHLKWKLNGNVFRKKKSAENLFRFLRGKRIWFNGKLWNSPEKGLAINTRIDADKKESKCSVQK